MLQLDLDDDQSAKAILTQLWADAEMIKMVLKEMDGVGTLLRLTVCPHPLGYLFRKCH